MTDLGENGLCPAGRATLRAHAERIRQVEQKNAKLEAKYDRILLLLVTTLVTAVLNFVWMLLDH